MKSESGAFLPRAGRRLSVTAREQAGRTPDLAHRRRRAGRARTPRRPGRPAALLAALLAVLLAAVLATAGCGDNSRSESGPQEPVTITVFASPTLTESFTALARSFSAAHPEISVELNFINAATGAAQLKEGLAADVFASADMAQMAQVADLTEEPVVFVGNTLMIAVEPGNPQGIHSLTDLARPDLLVALGAPGRPIGEYARQMLAAGGIAVEPDSLEESARAILTKVELGEVDAGIVMATDVRVSAHKVEGVAIPDDVNVRATYPIAVLEGSLHPQEAQAFLDYVLSSEAQTTLESFGFLPVSGL